MSETKYLVTRDSLQSMIINASPELKVKLVGRALVVLFNKQTESEKQVADTNVDNMEGFTSGDAYSGTLSAKSYLKYGTLKDWQLEKWLKVNRRGVMRIAKYWRQLDKAAKEKVVKRVDRVTFEGTNHQDRVERPKVVTNTGRNSAPVDYVKGVFA